MLDINISYHNGSELLTKCVSWHTIKDLANKLVFLFPIIYDLMVIESIKKLMLLNGCREQLWMNNDNKVINNDNKVVNNDNKVVFLVRFEISLKGIDQLIGQCNFMCNFYVFVIVSVSQQYKLTPECCHC